MDESIPKKIVKAADEFIEAALDKDKFQMEKIAVKYQKSFGKKKETESFFQALEDMLK